MGATESTTMKMYKSLLLGCVAGAVFASCAFAADLPVKQPIQRQPDIWNWTGFGIGGGIGYDWGTSDSSVTLWSKSLVGNTSPAGFAYMGTIYAQKQYANGWVPGVQVSWYGLSSDNNSVAVTGKSGLTKTDTFSQLLLGEFKLGYANLWRGWLPYATAGAACGRSSSTLAFTGGSSYTSNSGDNCGWTVGAGIDFAALSTGLGELVVGVKYNFVELGTMHTSFPIGSGGIGADIPNKQRENVVMLTASFLN
jgi:outer membrane immunogenic protein